MFHFGPTYSVHCLQDVRRSFAASRYVEKVIPRLMENVLMAHYYSVYIQQDGALVLDFVEFDAEVIRERNDMVVFLCSGTKILCKIH